MLARYFQIPEEEVAVRSASDPRKSRAIGVAVLRVIPTLPDEWLIARPFMTLRLDLYRWSYLQRQFVEPKQPDDRGISNNPDDEEPFGRFASAPSWLIHSLPGWIVRQRWMKDTGCSRPH